ncbi:MAG: BrnA antitoxin family protein [Sphingomicrobium sp.]
MRGNKQSLKGAWVDPDDAPELTDEILERAQFSIGGKVIREATGTLTKRGRPPVGDEPKQQVTLRLPREVIAYFKCGGPGWQTRIGEVLQRQVAKGNRKSA